MWHNFFQGKYLLLNMLDNFWRQSLILSSSKLTNQGLQLFRRFLFDPDKIIVILFPRMCQ